MFAPLLKNAYEFSTLSIAVNIHKYGISQETFQKDEGLKSMFRPTSISYDLDDKPFIATMESEKYPFFATQFHPEKEQFYFVPGTNIDHSEKSIYLNRYFGDFFVCHAKNNMNKYDTYKEEV